MSDLEKAARMALEALKQIDEAMPFPVAKFAQAALRQALEQPEYASDADTEELTHLNSLPEPLRLAAMLEKTMQWPLHGKAADCLRKMHAALSEQSAQQQEWRGPVDWEAVAADQAMTIAMMKAVQEPEFDRVKFERHWRKTRGEKKANRELPRHPLQPQTYIQDSANRHWVTWQAAVRSIARPASKPWVGLTDEQIVQLSLEWPAETNDWASHIDFARAIEAMLKEKNT